MGQGSSTSLTPDLPIHEDSTTLISLKVDPMREFREPREEPEGRPGGPGDPESPWESRLARLPLPGPPGLPSGSSWAPCQSHPVKNLAVDMSLTETPR